METLKAVSVTWDPAYGNLTRIKFGSGLENIYTGVAAPPSLSIDGLSGNIMAGQTRDLRFEFENDVAGAPLAFIATFNSGCIVQGSGP